MTPEVFECSPALKETLAALVQQAKFRVYDPFSREGLPADAPLRDHANTFVLNARQVDKHRVADTLWRGLWTQRALLSPELQEEVEQLTQHLLGVATGYGTPVLRIRNLPDGLDGVAAATALVQIISHKCRMNIDNLGKYVQPETHVGQPMHRDGGGNDDGPGIDLVGLLGVQTGHAPVTTAFADVDDWIDEITAQYNQRAETPMERSDMVAWLKTPCIPYYEVRTLSEPNPHRFHEVSPMKPILYDEPNAKQGMAWPKPLYAKLDTAKFFDSMRYGVECTDDPNMLTLMQAIKAAEANLHRGDGHVIEPGELTLFNNWHVHHAEGKLADAGSSELPPEDSFVGKHERRLMRLSVKDPCDDASRGYLVLRDDVPKNVPLR